MMFTQLTSTLQIIHRFDFKVVFFFYYYFKMMVCDSCDLSVQLCVYENTATLKEYCTEIMTLQS